MCEQSCATKIAKTRLAFRGATRGGQGGNNSPGAKSLWGHRITEGGAEKSQQCHKYFLQYSKFGSENAQVRPRGPKTCFLPRAPSNLVTPLVPF